MRTTLSKRPWKVAKTYENILGMMMVRILLKEKLKSWTQISTAAAN